MPTFSKRRLHQKESVRASAQPIFGRLILMAALFLSLTTSGSAQPSAVAKRGRAPEDWTIEERLEARFDPAAMKARLEADARDLGDPIPEGRDAAEKCVVDGARNPELFLPWELFQHLVTKGFASNPEMRTAHRKAMAAQVETLGSKVDFWSRLEPLVTDLLQLQKASKERGERSLSATGSSHRALLAEKEALDRRACAARHQALLAAREAFGGKHFDQFLYRAVAPTVKTYTSGNEWKEQLLFIEGGCQ